MPAATMADPRVRPDVAASPSHSFRRPNDPAQQRRGPGELEPRETPRPPPPAAAPVSADASWTIPPSSATGLLLGGSGNLVPGRRLRAHRKRARAHATSGAIIQTLAPPPIKPASPA